MVKHSLRGNLNRRLNCQYSCNYWRTPSYHHCGTKTHVFDANLQKHLPLQYKRSSKIKSEEYTKFLADKKALITIIFRQYDEATKTKIAFRETYAADRQARLLVKFLNQLRTVFLAAMTVAYHTGPINRL